MRPAEWVAGTEQLPKGPTQPEVGNCCTVSDPKDSSTFQISVPVGFLEQFPCRYRRPTILYLLSIYIDVSLQPSYKQHYSDIGE